MRTQQTSFARAILFVTMLFVTVASGGTRQKTDVVHLKNGDRITCEIKKLEYGKLVVKAPYATGNFTIDWAEVEKVDSPQSFVVETAAGVYFEGAIRSDANKDDKLEVRTSIAPVSLPQEEIVRVGQFGKGLIDRIKFAVDYGFGYARSNNQTQSTLHSEFQYRSSTVYTGATIDSLFASQDDAKDTNRHQGSAYYYRRIKASQWYGGWFGNVLTNNQQDLDLRLSGGAGVARNFFTTNRNQFMAQAGVVYNNEKYSVPAPDGQRFNSMEGAVGVRYSAFRFDSSEFITNFTVYPSFTQAGRVRTALDSSLYVKFAGDLYVRFGLYSNFDSRPPASTAKHDYGVSTSVGWSF